MCTYFTWAFVYQCNACIIIRKFRHEVLSKSCADKNVDFRRQNKTTTRMPYCNTRVMVHLASCCLLISFLLSSDFLLYKPAVMQPVVYMVSCESEQCSNIILLNDIYE